MIHVYPSNDEKPHKMTCACDCNPKIEQEKGRGCICIHRSFDGRESVEMAEEIINNDNPDRPPNRPNEKYNHLRRA